MSPRGHKASVAEDIYLLLAGWIVLKPRSEVRKLLIFIAVAPLTEMISDVKPSAQIEHRPLN